jgi:ankyrin repeat protein
LIAVVLLRDSQQDGMTPLHVAATNGCYNSAQYLLNVCRCAANPTMTVLDTAHRVTKGISITIISLLLEALQWTPLHCLARQACRPELVDLLVTHGADIDAKARDGYANASIIDTVSQCAIF